jgi:DNA processing protein
MTPDQALALSLIPDLGRDQFTERLRADDPGLLERADAFVNDARAERERAAARGVHAIEWNDPRFPLPLLAIADAPPALWYRGVLDVLDAPAVGIVGSRAASAVALETAGRLAADLASRGVVVVSGLARGVDSAAHRGALRTGRTIAVLGSGLERIYPPEHAGLARDIAGSGLVVSEYPPARPPLPLHFPQRNRLISGLSRAVVVIEASDGSGSLITAAFALQQGREVMAVPGNVLSGRNRGGHALIRDGAAIVESADDIMSELGLQPPPTVSKRSGSVDPILRGMDAGHAYDLDALADQSGMRAARLLPHLLDLELKGLIRRVEGGRFVRLA